MHADLFFFFSSRRRHTRSDRDWSSDVCSSDLNAESLYDPDKQSALQIQEVGALQAELVATRSEEHTSELQSRSDLVCRLLLEKKKKKNNSPSINPTKPTPRA